MGKYETGENNYRSFMGVSRRRSADETTADHVCIGKLTVMHEKSDVNGMITLD